MILRFYVCYSEDVLILADTGDLIPRFGRYVLEMSQIMG